MILTYKVKHSRDFGYELGIAKQVAEFAIHNRDKLSSKYVKNLGLKAAISNQILRKYGKNKKAKVAKSVKLTVPNQSIKYENNIINITCLKLAIPLTKTFSKINQIEIDEKYAYVSATVQEASPIIVQKHIGVDLNTTGHCAVVAVKETGKVYKLGKSSQHVHAKYKNIRRNLQKDGHYQTVKRIKNRESRIVKNINHNISRTIVNLAVREKASINIEKLSGIRETTKQARSFRYALNSWSYYQLGQFIEYKAALAGVPFFKIEPAYTSKCCSRCGQIGDRNGKKFKCPCGYVEHADVNAAFNIALPSQSIVQLQAERDVCKGSTDTPRKATRISHATLRTQLL